MDGEPAQTHGDCQGSLRAVRGAYLGTSGADCASLGCAGSSEEAHLGTLDGACCKLPWQAYLLCGLLALKNMRFPKIPRHQEQQTKDDVK